MDKRSFQVKFKPWLYYLLDKEYLMNVVNTLDEGLIVRTVKKILNEK
jgi:hypothetical protein